MSNLRRSLSLAVVLALSLAGTSTADEATSTTKAASKANAQPGIVWYATLDDARAEAKRSGKPILFLSAAPHCRNISGMW